MHLCQEAVFRQCQKLCCFCSHYFNQPDCNSVVNFPTQVKMTHMKLAWSDGPLSGPEQTNISHHHHHYHHHHHHHGSEGQILCCRSPLWGDHPRGLEQDQDELWNMLLDGYGGSAEDDVEAADWDSVDEGEADKEAGIIASPIVPLDESTPDELCRCCSSSPLPPTPPPPSPPPPPPPTFTWALLLFSGPTPTCLTLVRKVLSPNQRMKSHARAYAALLQWGAELGMVFTNWPLRTAHDLMVTADGHWQCLYTFQQGGRVLSLLWLQSQHATCKSIAAAADRTRGPKITHVMLTSKRTRASPRLERLDPQ